jgi:hypothetical protein
LFAWKPGEVGDVGVIGPTAHPAITGSASKLTLTAFFLLADALAPSSEALSDASLGGAWLVTRATCGDEFLAEAEYFKADFAGETDRGGGLCLTPFTGSMGKRSKWA